MRNRSKSKGAAGAYRRPTWLLAAVCFLVTSAGCAISPAAVATFANTTVPVSVGPVDRMASGSNTVEVRPTATFRVDATNLYRYNASAGGGATIHRQTEDAAIFDVAVEKALDKCGTCRVQVDHVFVGSHSAVLIGVSDDTHWTGTDVELYSRKSTRK